MRQLLAKMFKQKNVGNTWGYIAQTASQGAVFITVVNFFMLAATFFATALSPYLLARAIAIPFWLFIVGLTVPFVIVGFILFKYAVPSFFSAFDHQLLKHGSKLKNDMEELKQGNRDIMERLEKMEKGKEDENE